MRINLRIVQARTVDAAILELIENEKYDLLVMGAVISDGGSRYGSAVVERVLKESTCPVWISCISDDSKIIDRFPRL